MFGQAESIDLKDGRKLFFATYGDPRGKPVFFFHGTPGCRFFRPSDEVTKNAGIRLICTDRPGYGGSTFQPGRRYLDWPGDVVQLADSLGIDQFAVAGHSGGGPHALACAYTLPRRVTVAVAISGAGPVDSPQATEGMTALNWFGFTFGRYIPWPLARLLSWWFFHERCADPARVMDRETGTRPLADDQLLCMPDVREICLQSDVEAFRQGLQAMSWEIRLLTRRWGFPLNSIQVPVYLWHGTADNMTSVRMAQYMAAQIPNCQSRICEAEGHLLLFPHWKEILTQLQ